MNHDLIKRYIYAVASHLPAKAQPEIEKELESMITELLDARCGDSEPSDADIRAVLTELGTPEELAVKYSGDENKALISGIYLLWFKRILKIVLPIVAIAVAFSCLLSAIVNWETQELYEFIPETAAEIISGGISGAVQAFMWVTLVFIILEYKKVKFSDGDFLSKLRPVPDKRAQIKIFDPVFGILWCITGAVLFLGFPHLLGMYTGNAWIPIFDTAYIREHWYFVAAWTAFGLIKEAAKLSERRYSKRLAYVTAGLNVLSGLSCALFFAKATIMNRDFIQKVVSFVPAEGAEWFNRSLGQVNIAILAVILFSLAIDVGVTFYRAFRYNK